MEQNENTVQENDVNAPLPEIHEEQTQRESSAEPQEISKKKRDKSFTSLMKALGGAATSEEKLNLICKKHVEVTEENKKLQFYIKQSDKRFALVTKEKEHLQMEYNKSVLVKSRLENLCRELQKQNKFIKEESILKLREEEERRKQTQAKFQSTLSEITSMLHQDNEKNAKLRDENLSMSEKFKSVLQEYQLREQQVDKMAQQMQLESQLSDAKMQKASLEHQAEKERMLSEIEQLKMELYKTSAKVLEQQDTVKSLKTQLSVYTDKYDDFQNALVKSNKVFSDFKSEVEKMTKKNEKLQKESLSWRTKWERSQASLIECCGEKHAAELRTISTQKHLDQMQRLCRTLQAERTVLMNTLKENNIERPPLPPPPPPVPDKTEAKTQLRESLTNLQNQLNVLAKNSVSLPKTNELNAVNTAPKADKKKTKSKNKPKTKDGGEKFDTSLSSVNKILDKIENIKFNEIKPRQPQEIIKNEEVINNEEKNNEVTPTEATSSDNTKELEITKNLLDSVKDTNLVLTDLDEKIDDLVCDIDETIEPIVMDLNLNELDLNENSKELDITNEAIAVSNENSDFVQPVAKESDVAV